VLDHPPTHAFVDELLVWVVDWAAANQTVKATHGPTDGNKVAAWVQAEGPSSNAGPTVPLVIGQVTVWESGECEVQVLDVSTGEPRWFEHFDFGNAEQMTVALERFRAAIDCT